MSPSEAVSTGAAAADEASVPPMLRAIQSSLGSDVLHRIRSQSNVLVVGAGGIGCELLKNLALCGFARVSVIDLDTIDVSNLNRQLLFRSNHVGMPKSTVACQVATSNLLGTKDGDTKDDETSSGGSAAAAVMYTAMHGNVCDNDVFNVPFVSQFDVVLNALDNVTARRRVNRLCLAAKDGVGVPMVEAGTTGYLGQVSVITRAVQCYECRPQEPPKVYPICTIRSTPSAPVHTIVWAKECYKLLFYPKVEESMLYEAVNADEISSGTGQAKTDPDDHDNSEGGGYEPSVYMQDVLAYRAALCSKGGKGSDDRVANGDDLASGNTAAAAAVPDVNMLAHKLLKALYCDEMSKQLAMDRYKTARKTPVAMTLSNDDDDEKKSKAPTTIPSWSTTQVWTQQECAAEFVQCLMDAHEREVDVLPEFDKDDELAMRFVTAASNLRNYVFGIEPLQSYYSAKVTIRENVIVLCQGRR
jgi:ubiquitin-like 1-activating enzyme E1 B